MNTHSDSFPVTKLSSLKMELLQQIETIKKESTENSKLLDHWSNEHDKLKLEEIEYVFTRQAGFIF
jgi:hypothetical protein